MVVFLLVARLALPEKGQPQAFVIFLAFAAFWAAEREAIMVEILRELMGDPEALRSTRRAFGEAGFTIVD